MKFWFSRHVRARARVRRTRYLRAQYRGDHRIKILLAPRAGKGGGKGATEVRRAEHTVSVVSSMGAPGVRGGVSPGRRINKLSARSRSSCWEPAVLPGWSGRGRTFISGALYTGNQWDGNSVVEFSRPTATARRRRQRRRHARAIRDYYYSQADQRSRQHRGCFGNVN